MILFVWQLKGLFFNLLNAYKILVFLSHIHKIIGSQIPTRSKKIPIRTKKNSYLIENLIISNKDIDLVGNCIRSSGKSIEWDDPNAVPPPILNALTDYNN